MRNVGTRTEEKRATDWLRLSTHARLQSTTYRYLRKLTWQAPEQLSEQSEHRQLDERTHHEGERNERAIGKRGHGDGKRDRGVPRQGGETEAHAGRPVELGDSCNRKPEQ